MKRRLFIKKNTLVVAGIFLPRQLTAMTAAEPQIYYFKDDGNIPNSQFPLLVYKNVFPQRGQKGGIGWNNVLLKTAGLIAGGAVFIPFTIITAPHTRSWAVSVARH
ncbi:hypothetical protein [Chryseobacterium sp. FH2]|uniref:hypothetical protein n=1 Tax=Chryseobacterium sp. FH2 TaxID=1674291 RepID=UPI000AC3E6FF|nr:hypothetical protein [Chryseobacterium sp. FH2]